MNVLWKRIKKTKLKTAHKPFWRHLRLPQAALDSGSPELTRPLLWIKEL